MQGHYNHKIAMTKHKVMTHKDTETDTKDPETILSVMRPRDLNY